MKKIILGILVIFFLVTCYPWGYVSCDSDLVKIYEDDFHFLYGDYIVEEKSHKVDGEAKASSYRYKTYHIKYNNEEDVYNNINVNNDILHVFINQVYERIEYYIERKLHIDYPVIELRCAASNEKNDLKKVFGNVSPFLDSSRFFNNSLCYLVINEESILVEMLLDEYPYLNAIINKQYYFQGKQLKNISNTHEFEELIKNSSLY